MKETEKGNEKERDKEKEGYICIYIYIYIYMIEQGLDPFNNSYTFDIDASSERCHVMKGRVKCLLKARTKGYWVTSRGRRMNLDELLRAQGIDPRKMVKAQGITQAQYGAMAGNAMSQNVLEAIFEKMCTACGWSKLSADQQRTHSSDRAQDNNQPTTTIDSSNPDAKKRRWKGAQRQLSIDTYIKRGRRTVIPTQEGTGASSSGHQHDRSHNYGNKAAATLPRRAN